MDKSNARRTAVAVVVGLAFLAGVVVGYAASSWNGPGKSLAISSTRQAPGPRIEAPSLAAEREQAGPLIYPPGAESPVIVSGDVEVQPTKLQGFGSLDLSKVFNRPHDSMMIGGGDDASFATWFEGEDAITEGVPFRIGQGQRDVLVSQNNTENAFDLKIRSLEREASAVHFLVWGYMRPEPAQLSMTFSDGMKQEFELPVISWTRAPGKVAFDFKSTIRSFAHAAVTHHAIKIEGGPKKIVGIQSRSGRFGVIAITIEESR